MGKEEHFGDDESHCRGAFCITIYGKQISDEYGKIVNIYNILTTECDTMRTIKETYVRGRICQTIIVFQKNCKKNY